MRAPSLALWMVLMLLPNALQAESETAALRSQVETLRSQVQIMQQQIESLLTKIDDLQATAVVATVTKENSREPQIKFGGRIKVDLLHSSASGGAPGGASRADSVLLPQFVPLISNGEENEITSSARDSQFFMHAIKPLSQGELNAYIEFDFASSDGAGDERVSNAYNPRLRHAYTTYRGFTIGQTTTTFSNPGSFAELNNQTLTAGTVYVRQPLLRYQSEMPGYRWLIAMEQPETVLTNLQGDRETVGDDQYPDIVGRIDLERNWGTLSASALVRQLRRSDSGQSDDIWTAAVSLSGRLYTSGADNLRFAFTSGEGLGRYMTFNGFNDAVLLPDGRIVATDIDGAYLSYQHWWNPTIRTNIGYGLSKADLDDFAFTSGVNERLETGHVNLAWSPNKSMTFAVEWLYGHRELTDGRDASLQRVHVTGLYKFSN